MAKHLYNVSFSEGEDVTSLEVMASNQKSAYAFVRRNYPESYGKKLFIHRKNNVVRRILD